MVIWVMYAVGWVLSVLIQAQIVSQAPNAKHITSIGEFLKCRWLVVAFRGFGALCLFAGVWHNASFAAWVGTPAILVSWPVAGLVGMFSDYALGLFLQFLAKWVPALNGRVPGLNGGGAPEEQKR